MIKTWHVGVGSVMVCCCMMTGPGKLSAASYEALSIQAEAVIPTAYAEASRGLDSFNELRKAAPGKSDASPAALQGWGFHNPSGDYVASPIQSGMSIRPRTNQVFEPNTGRFGILHRAIPAGAYRGKRIRYSANVQYKDVETLSDVWMRVDGADGTPRWFDLASTGLISR